VNEAERSVYNKRRNGNSSTKESNSQIKKKIFKSPYYQVTHIEIDNRPRQQKVQNMLKIKAIMQTANEAMEETLDG
jgi:hypothetical protein